MSGDLSTVEALLAEWQRRLNEWKDVLDEAKRNAWRPWRWPRDLRRMAECRDAAHAARDAYLAAWAAAMKP